MKRILLLLSLTVLINFSFAQELIITDTLGNQLNKDTLFVSGTTNDVEIATLIHVENTTANNYDFSCQRFIVEEPAGVENFFCWDICYTPFVNESQSPMTINAGETFEDFSSHHKPNNTTGVSIVRYRIFASHGPTDTVFVKYTITQGNSSIREFASSIGSISAPQPNPANNTTRFVYTLKDTEHATLKIHNILGSIVYTTELVANKGAVDVNTSGFLPGVYFCSFGSGNKSLTTQKLIISR